MLRICLAAALALAALTAADPAFARHRGHHQARAPICGALGLTWPCLATIAVGRRDAAGRGALVSVRRHNVASSRHRPGRASLGLAAAGARPDLRSLVDQAAAAAGVPAHLAHAVIRQESDYNPALRGSAGEWGIGQIKCPTARSVGFSGSCGQLADAATNLRYSMAYLRLALDRGGRGCAGVSLYQRGVFARPGCSGYGRQVMARAEALR
jgi:hypothetical protein